MVQRWERFKDPWDREYAMRGRLWRGRTDASRILRHLDEGVAAFEVGCGDGRMLVELQEAGYRTLGLDRSLHALRLARERGGRYLVRGDMVALPVRDAAYGAVVARHALGALDARGRDAAAAELWRVVAPRGVLVVEEFAVGDFREGIGEPVEPGTWERNRGIRTHYFASAEMQSLMPRRPDVLKLRTWVQRTTEQPMDRAAWRAVWRKPAAP